MNKYYEKYLKFLHDYDLYDKDLFNYLKKNTIRFKYNDNKNKMKIGLYPIYKNDYLIKFYLVAPYFDSDKSVVINIHEYIESNKIYENIGKKFDFMEDNDYLSLYYERLFIMNYPTKRLNKYKELLDKKINDFEIEDNNKILKRKI